MKRYFFLQFLLLTTSIMAQGLWTIKAGVNYSAFRDDDNELIGNYSLGVSRKIVLLDNFALAPQLTVSSQGGMLRNKPTRNDEPESYLNSYNYRVAIQLIEFGLMMNYFILNKPYEISFNLGPSWRIGLHDESHRFNKKIVYDIDNPERRQEFVGYDYKYIIGDPAFLNASGWAINMGATFKFKRVSIETIYSVALHDIGAFEVLREVDKKSHALHFLVGIQI